jgi:hypothetical protein
MRRCRLGRRTGGWWQRGATPTRLLLITSEYRYGTIHATLLFTPHRRRVLTAKLTAGLLAGSPASP